MRRDTEYRSSVLHLIVEFYSRISDMFKEMSEGKGKQEGGKPEKVGEMK